MCPYWYMVYMYILVYMCAHACTISCMCVCTCTYIYAFTTWLYTCPITCACTCIFTHNVLYAHMHTLTHTHTHAYLPRRPALATVVPWETSSGSSRWPASWPLTCSWFAPPLLSALTSCDYWRRPASVEGGSSSVMVTIIEFTCMHMTYCIFFN